MADLKLSELAGMLEPFLLNLIGQATGGVGPFAPSPHDLGSSHHTGSISDAQGPQFIKIDGSRQLVGNLAVASLITIDGVDLDVFKSGYDAHLSGDGHPDYVSKTTARTISAVHTFNPPSPSAPFILGANGQGQTVTGLKADTLNKTITASTGLSGGGALTSNVSLSVDQSFSPTWTGTHQFDLGVKIGADITLNRKSANVLQLATGDAFQSSTYTSGVAGWAIAADGSAEFANVRVRGELSSTVFKYNEIQATAGAFGVFKSASTLTRDITTASAVNGTFTVYVKTTDMSAALIASGDIIRIRTFSGTGFVDAWATVGTVTTTGNESSFTATLKAGSTSASIKTGTAVVDYGPASSGFIMLSADNAYGAPANMSIATHSGTPWAPVAADLRVRLGNLNGSYGVPGGSNYYGIGIGDYSGGNYLKYDTNSGFSIKAGGGNVLFDDDGLSLVFGTDTALPQAAVGFRYTDGVTYGGMINGYRQTASSYNSMGFYSFGNAAGDPSMGSSLIMGAYSTNGSGLVTLSADGQYLAGNGSMSDLTLSGATALTSSATLRSGKVSLVAEGPTSPETGRADLYSSRAAYGVSGISYAKFAFDLTITKALTFTLCDYNTTATPISNAEFQYGAIINDGTNYKALMIMGNTSAGGSRRTRVYDDLIVQNDLSVNGSVIVSNPVWITAYKAALQTITNGGSYQKLLIDTVAAETLPPSGTSQYSGNSLYCRLAGVYYIFARVEFAANGTGYRALRLYKNGTAYHEAKQDGLTSGTSTTIEIAMVLPLVSGDRVDIYVYQTSGGNLDVIVTGITTPQMRMIRLA